MKITLKPCLAIFAGVLACWLAAAPALAATPTTYVRGILDEVMGIQNDPAMAESARKEAIRRVIQRSFDFDHMSKDSLGRTYNRLSAGQRQEFNTVFSALFQDSYTRLVLNFLKQETVEYGREQAHSNNARVDTVLIRVNERIPVDYLMHRRGANWILYDVIVDGVSILDNYQRQFAQVISARSFEHLMERMRIQYRAIQ